MVIDESMAALAASFDPVSLTDRIAEHVCVFLPKADGAGVGIVTSSGRLAMASAHGISAPLSGHVIELRGTFHELALRSRQPQSTEDATRDRRISPATWELARRLGIRSWVVVPLFHRGTTVGALSVVAANPGVFDDADIAALAATSQLVSALISLHSEISTLLDDLTDRTNGATGSTTQFLASMLNPIAERPDRFHELLNTVLADDDSISAVFQPIVDLASGQPWAFEGLVRFHADADLDTAQWFEMARRLGRSASLELKALGTVLHAAQHLPPGHSVAINLSPQVASGSAARHMLATADRQIVLEITEYERFPDTLATDLIPLRQQGVLIAVDDAGAGFASFAQLLRLRPDVIKIDGELTADIDADPVKRALVSAMVSLAHDIGARTVAEAIETTHQLQTVTDLKVDYGQGFLLGRPSPVIEHSG